MAEAGTVGIPTETGEAGNAAEKATPAGSTNGTGEGAWYESIADDRIKSVAQAFPDEKSFLDALGFEEAGDSGDWRASLDEDARKFAESSPDIKHLVSRAVQMHKKLSAAIVPPGKDADEATIAAFRKRMGVPESPEGYKFTLPEGAEVTDADKAFQAKIAEAAHAANISTEQMSVLNEAWNGMIQAMQQQQIEEDRRFAEQSEAELRRAWPGKEFDVNKTFAERAAARIFGDQLDDLRTLETKDGRFVLDHPLMLRGLAVIGREMAEGGLVPKLDPEEAETLEEQIRDLRQKQKAAKAQGDMNLANEFYKKELAARRQLLAGKK